MALLSWSGISTKSRLGIGFNVSGTGEDPEMNLIDELDSGSRPSTADSTESRDSVDVDDITSLRQRRDSEARLKFTPSAAECKGKRLENGAAVAGVHERQKAEKRQSC